MCTERTSLAPSRFPIQSVSGASTVPFHCHTLLRSKSRDVPARHKNSNNTTVSFPHKLSDESDTASANPPFQESAAGQIITGRHIIILAVAQSTVKLLQQHCTYSYHFTCNIEADRMTRFYHFFCAETNRSYVWGERTLRRFHSKT